MALGSAIHVFALLEAETVTGPAANLLQFHRSASALAEAGRAPSVRLTLGVFQRGAGEPRTPLCDAAARAGVPVVAIRERFRLDPRTVARIRELTDAARPDVVQTHGVKSHLLMRLARRRRRYAWVAFHHGYTRPDTKMAVYNQCDWLSLRAAERVVTPAHAFVRELEIRGVASDRIFVLHNAVDIDPLMDRQLAAERRRVRASLGIAPHERVVVCIGRLSFEKGHADLLDAMAILRAHDPSLPVRLVVAGDGPERSRLAARVAQAGIVEMVLWLGFVPQARQLYAGADVAVLPSHSEGCPNALLEAAAYRLPIVATAVGDVGDSFAHGQSGLLVPPRRPAALAAALADVLTDRSRSARLGQEARRVVETRHRPAVRAQALIGLYRDVTGLRGGVSSEGARACGY